MSYAIHKEHIQSTVITSIIIGKFAHYPRFSDKLYEPSHFHQLIVCRNCHFDLYELKDPHHDKVDFITQFKLYGNIMKAVKIKKFNQNLDSIALLIDNNKIIIIGWDINVCDFKTKVMFNISKLFCSLKRSTNLEFNFIFSNTYNKLVFTTNDDRIHFVSHYNLNLEKSNSKYLNIINQNNVKLFDMEEDNLDSLFSISLQENYKVKRIIKISFPYYDLEQSYYYNYLSDNQKLNSDVFYLIILFEHTSSTLINKVEKEETLRNQKSIGLFQLEMKNLTTELKQNSFKDLKNKTLYSEFLNLDFSKFFNINCIDQFYVAEYCHDFLYFSNSQNYLVFGLNFFHLINKEKLLFKTYALGHNICRDPFLNILDNKYLNVLNIELRGSAYCFTSFNSIMFVCSKGSLYSLIIDESEINISNISIKGGSKNQLAKIKTLGMGYTYVNYIKENYIVLAGKHVDCIFAKYDTEFQEYAIFQSIINVTPIINFNYINDKSFFSKFMITAGIDKSSNINFISEKFLYETPQLLKRQNDISECIFIKDINDSCLIKGNKDGFNVLYKKVSFKLVEIVDYTNGLESIFYNNNTKNVLKDIISLEENIFIILLQRIAIVDKEFSVLKYSCNFCQLLNNNNSCETIISTKLLIENKIISLMNNDNLLFIEFDEHKPMEQMINITDLTDILDSKKRKIIKFDITYNNYFTNDESTYFIAIFRQDGQLDISNFIINKSTFKSQIKIEKIIHTSIFTDIPNIISGVNEINNDRILSSSDLTIPLHYIQNTTEIQFGVIPDEILIEIFDKLVLFIAVSLEKRMFVIYELLINNEQNKGYAKLKKLYFEMLINQELILLFRNEINSMFTKFNNLGSKKGVFVNILGQQKIVFIVNGKLTIVEFDNRFLQKSIDAFSVVSFNSDSNNNNSNNNRFFCYQERGVLILCKIPTNYNITELGLINRSILGRFPYLSVPLIFKEGTFDQITFIF